MKNEIVINRRISYVFSEGKITDVKTVDIPDYDKIVMLQEIYGKGCDFSLYTSGRNHILFLK